MHPLIEADIYCPYCGEINTVLVEPAEDVQEYIEDCQVCCRPIVFNVSMQPGQEMPTIQVRTTDET